MDELRDGQIELKVHGLQHVNNSEVPAAVFAAKLRALVTALEAADQVAHGGSIHQYTIARLHTSSPTAILNERPTPKLSVSPSVSALPAFTQGIDVIKAGARPSADMTRFASAIARMTFGAEKTFGFAEVRTRTNVVRIDQFLRERAQAAARPLSTEGIPEGGWYKGVVFGSFDGRLEYVDLRGALPQIKLTLSAGGKQIDCICSKEDIERLGPALDQRVRVSGRAIYDGRAGLPRRVEVTDIQLVTGSTDFTRWRGTFEPFSAPSWLGEDA